MKSTFQATLLMFAGVAMAAPTAEEAEALIQAEDKCRYDACMVATSSKDYCN